MSNKKKLIGGYIKHKLFTEKDEQVSFIRISENCCTNNITVGENEILSEELYRIDTNQKQYCCVYCENCKVYHLSDATGNKYAAFISVIYKKKQR